MRKLSRQIIVCFVWLYLLACILNAGCNARKDSSKPISLYGKTMGTRYNITLAELPRGSSEEDLQAEIDQLLERVNDQMSTYRPESEISRFNRYARSDWFSVSPETAEVVKEALLVSRETDGAFDVTVGPLVDLWGFGPGKRERTVPSEKEIQATMAMVGYHRLEVRISPPALKKRHRDIRVDLAAIAKGFGVDQIAESLGSYDIPGYLVEIGGEVRAHGTKKDGKGWRIGVERPSDDRMAIQEIVMIGNRAMATSGDYRNFFKKEGKRYSHTIDPRSGRPVEHNLASVSVIDEKCMRADAWATALMVLGPEKGYQLAVQRGLTVLFLIRSGEGFVRRTTPAFDAFVERQRGDS